MSTKLRTYTSDDPLNDGVELVEDLQDQAGLPTGDRMDVAKIRIEKLNQERQERVARRRDPQSCLKRGCIASYPTAASSPPDATSPAHRWARNTCAAVCLQHVRAGDGAGVPCGGGSADHLLLHPSGHRGEADGAAELRAGHEGSSWEGCGLLLAFNMWLFSFGGEVSYMIYMGDLIGAFIDSSQSAPDYVKSSSGRRLITSMGVACCHAAAVPTEGDQLPAPHIRFGSCICLFLCDLRDHPFRSQHYHPWHA
ncbi:hypothetical protein TcBrA4_0034150 [Trypanosoma cruzi]|nr:hypothetical protein TcBrA4_0034150 [Trypanosoma cruzi]